MNKLRVYVIVESEHELVIAAADDETEDSVSLLLIHVNYLWAYVIMEF